MSAHVCTLLPACPLPLDPASAEGAYELIKENSLPVAVKELLDSVDSFVGRQLALQQGKHSKCNSFCSYHSDLVGSAENPSQLEDMWILQRDISVQLFKIMMGVVRSAADLACRLRNLGKGDVSVNTRPVNALDDSDLELAFTGDARGGYQWLNCLAKDECEWVWEAINNESQSLELHCPACLLGRAIDSESTIRLLISAARLLKWDFFVVSIQEHLANDPWWGPGYWETIEPKANVLGTQIRDLLQQCAEVRLKLQHSDVGQEGKLIRSMALNSRRAISYGTSGPQPYSVNNPPSSIPLKVDMRQLDQLVHMLSEDKARNGQHLVADALRPYKNGGMSNNYKFATYCWFLLVHNISMAPSDVPVPPRDERTSRVKTRSKTV